MSFRNLTCLGLLAPVLLCAQSLADFEKKVTEFTLKNGMHFIVMERHEAPTVAFHAHVNAGAANDPANASSTAHMFEHMIGKGTASLGSKNFPAEQKALAAVEDAYDRLEEERRKERRADKAQVERLEAALKKATAEADKYVEQNAFTREIEKSGGVGFNASTGLDTTNYFYSLPSNRTELWFVLQSEWFRQPVFREFYKERDVVREERRMRVESSAQGKLIEAMMTTAFTAHPYRNFIGWASDIENLRAKGAAEFHKTYYVPANITVAVVGDVNTAQIKQMAEKYFGPIPAGPLPPRLYTVEPPQNGEKRVTVDTEAQPFLAIAYHRPEGTHPDDPAIAVLDGILSGGRTGKLNRELVEEKKLALGADTGAIFPSGKYPNLFIAFMVPNAGKTVEDLEKAWDELIEKMKKDPIDEAAVKRVKIKLRAGFIAGLDSNSGLARQMAESHVALGSWKMVFTELDDLEKVTSADVKRVLNTYLTKNNRTVAYSIQTKPEGK